MAFVFLGFDHSATHRQFRFESIGADRCRTPVVVIADLLLARQYHILPQNLPLLCRKLLEHTDAGELAAGVITLTQTHMEALDQAARAETEQKKSRRSHATVGQNA